MFIGFCFEERFQTKSQHHDLPELIVRQAIGQLEKGEQKTSSIGRKSITRRQNKIFIKVSLYIYVKLVKIKTRIRRKII